MLNEIQILNNRSKIVTQLKSTNRDGIDNLIKYMDDNGFYLGPSSTKWHQAYKGGNAEHSIEVFDALDQMNKNLGLSISQDSLIIVALLHDICKIDSYVELEDGKYTWNETAESGHGKKSVRIISKFIKLTDIEKDAIAYHMGAYERKEFDWEDLGTAYRRNKLSYYVHVADMRSTYGF